MSSNIPDAIGDSAAAVTSTVTGMTQANPFAAYLGVLLAILLAYFIYQGHQEKVQSKELSATIVRMKLDDQKIDTAREQRAREFFTRMHHLTQTITDQYSAEMKRNQEAENRFTVILERMAETNVKSYADWLERSKDVESILKKGFSNTHTKLDQIISNQQLRGVIRQKQQQ